MADKKAEAAKRLKERTAKKRFKLPEGDTTFRVMPNAVSTKKREYFEYGMHSEVGPRKAYLRCGKDMKGEGDCWLCDEMIPQLESSKNSAKREAAERVARKDVFAVQIAYQDGDEWVGPILWEMSTGIANKLLGVLANPKRDVSDPEKGYNITISRTGTGPRDTRYGDMDRDDDPSEAPEEALKKLKPFSEVVRKYDEKEMKAAYYGHEQDEDEEETPKKKSSDEDEDEEEETPKKKKSKEEDDEDEKPKKKSKDEDEEEETEEEDEDDEDEKPKKKSKDEDEEEKPKKKKSKDEDEDEVEEALSEDDEIPDLDEEEEEKPKKKKSKDEDEDDEDEKPKKKKSKDEDEDEDEEEKPKKKKSKDEDESEDDEDEEESTPKKKKSKSDDDDDE